MNKYEHWNKILCEELCDHMKAFDECRDYENLCMIEKLAKTAVALGELEAIGAMRDYAESEFGYDSETGAFRSREREPMYAGIYNAAGMPKTMRTIAGQYPSTSSGSMRSTERDWGQDYGYGGDSRYGERMGDRQGTRGNRYGETGMMPYRNVYNAADPEEAKKHMKKLTESDYKRWLEDMEGPDGDGAEWDKEQSLAVAKKLGVKFDDFSEWTWIAVLNSLYTDYHDALKKVNPTVADDPMTYGRLALAFLDDPDMGVENGDEKAALYYRHIVEGK